MVERWKVTAERVVEYEAKVVLGKKGWLAVWLGEVAMVIHGFGRLIDKRSDPMMQLLQHRRDHMRRRGRSGMAAAACLRQPWRAACRAAL